MKKKKKSPHPSDPVSTRNIFFSFKVLEHAPKVKDIKDVGIFFFTSEFRYLKWTLAQKL